MARKKAPAGALASRTLQRTFIMEWRAHRGLNQDVLASRVEEILGVSFTTSTLSRIENGKGPYSQPQLEALAEALGCSTGDLLERHPQTPPPISMQDLPEGDAERVYQFIRALRVSRVDLEGNPSPDLPDTLRQPAIVKARRRKAQS